MIKVGIIGAGRIGKVHATSIATRIPEAKIAAIADPFMNDETVKWAKSLGIDKCVKDYKELL
jgi:myo-inositol 2-dehydrogenase/D-chiro-inositol 1-dehydrogenase